MARRPQHTREWALGVVALLLLTACGGVDDAAVEELERLPGVESARASCVKFVDCTASVSVAGDVTVAELEAIIEASRRTEARDITLDVEGDGTTTARLSTGPGSSPDLDRPTAELLLRALEVDGLQALEVTRFADETSLRLRGDAARSEFWPVARDLWERAEPLGLDSLAAETTASEDDDEGPSQLRASAAFPTESVALVLDLDEGEIGPWGVVVEDSRIGLGALSLPAATRLEEAVADAAGADLSVQVDVTRGLPTLPTEPGAGPTADGAGSEADRRAVLTLLEERGLGATAEARTVVVDGRSSSVEDVVTGLRAVREELSDESSVVPLTVELDVDVVVELGTDGGPDLVELAADLAADRGADSVEIGQPRADAEAPWDAEAQVFVEVAAPDLASGVETVAEAVSSWAGSERSLVVGVTAVDPDGRSPSATVRVDRRGEDWVARGVGRGTPETEAEAVAAWGRGVDVALRGPG